MSFRLLHLFCFNFYFQIFQFLHLKSRHSSSETYSNTQKYKKIKPQLQHNVGVNVFLLYKSVAHIVTDMVLVQIKLPYMKHQNIDMQTPHEL